MKTHTPLPFRKKIFRVGAFALFVFLMSVRPPGVTAAVVINEVFPKTTDPANQWIELYNSGTETVPLNQWKIENSANGGKSYIIAASGTVPAKGFYTLSRSQTGLSLSYDGDTVTLRDAGNTVVDTKNYPGTLGYNTSMGRSPDGADGWIICNAPTQNQPNDCPVPTPSPSPTLTPAPPPLPTDAPAAPVITAPPVTTNAPVPTLAGIIVNPTAATLTPTPTVSPDIVRVELPKVIEFPKNLAVQIAIVAAAWILLAVVARLNRKHGKHHPPKSE